METLRSARLLLTPLDPDADAADLHRAYGDPEVARSWQDEEPPKDEDETRERLAARVALEGSRLWAIRLLDGSGSGSGDASGDRPAALGLVELVGSGANPWMSWMLRRDHWSRGITGAAAAMVVEHLFAADDGLDCVEAWADASNLGSIGVARRAGLTERGRFMLDTRLRGIREKVVLGRTRDQRNQAFYAAHPVLPVRDVAEAVRLLCDGLGLVPGFTVGEPVQYAAVRLAPWTMGPSLRLARVDDRSERATPVTVALDSGLSLAALEARFTAAGGKTDGGVRRMPWDVYELCCLLADGHRLLISGQLA